MADITNFKNQWLGRRVDFDKVYAFQCVDLVRQYFYEEYGIGNAAGGVPTAISYWTATPSGLLDKFDRVEGSSARNGDIVILRTYGRTDFSGNGHIGIATGNINDAKVEILEQNGSTGNGSGLGPDAIRTRWVERSRVAGLLRPKAEPASEPAPSQATGMPFTVAAIEPKKVQLNKYPTNEWDLSKTTWPAFNENPIVHNGEEVVTVTAIANHNLGGHYYMQNGAVARGFNLVDCTDYVEPTPVPEPPKPENYATHYTYSKLDTPLELQAKIDAHKWDLNYDDYKNAQTQGLLAKGTRFTAYGKAVRNDLGHEVYFMTEADYGTAPVAAYGVNTVDLEPYVAPAIETPQATPDDGEKIDVNVIPVDPNKWKTLDETVAGDYIATETIALHDLEQARPDVLLEDGQTFSAAGSIYKDGLSYFITKKGFAAGRWYGIPVTAAELESLDTDGDIFDLYKDRNGDGKVDLRDEALLAIENFNIRSRAIIHLGTLDGILRSIAAWFKRKR